MAEHTSSAPDIDRLDSVRGHAPIHVTRRLDEEMIERVRYLADQPDEIITARLEALEGEWDVERWLGANASAISLLGLSLVALNGRKWLFIPFAVAVMLLRNAIVGWSPPALLLRSLGVRTRPEVEAEKQALRILRGDYLGAATTGTPKERADEALKQVGIL
jgi:hypothetical protein